MHSPQPTADSTSLCIFAISKLSQETEAPSDTDFGFGDSLEVSLRQTAKPSDAGFSSPILPLLYGYTATKGRMKEPERKTHALLQLFLPVKTAYHPAPHSRWGHCLCSEMLPAEEQQKQVNYGKISFPPHIK